MRADVIEIRSAAAQVENLSAWRTVVAGGSSGARIAQTCRPSSMRPRNTAPVGRAVAETRGAAEHHAAVGDHHLAAVVDAQHGGVGPARNGGVDVGAQLVGAVGTDARQQRHMVQSEVGH